jgi:hypothetical protein
MDKLRGIYGNVVVVPQRTYGFDMVRMVVRYKDCLDLAQSQPILFKYLPQGADSYASIYKYSFFACVEKVAVTAAPAAKAYKFEHFLVFNFAQSYEKETK